MRYWIILRNPNPGGDYLDFYGETPAHIRQDLIEHTKDDFVEKKLKLCHAAGCTGTHCHVIEKETGRKYCPILFSDLIGRFWNAKDLESAAGEQDSPWAREQLNRQKEAVMEANRAEVIEYLKVTDIHPSNNYRKSMDKIKLAELTASVKEQGVLQPITVRPNNKGYEIVFGERRWRASTAAGLVTIPAIVRKLTDKQALEMAIIENDQREDPNPMDQALGYKRLMDEGIHNIDSLMARLDHTRDYIEGRMRLLKLPKEVQDRLRDGSIPVSHSLYLTRLRDEGDIKKLANEVIKNDFSLNRLKEEVRRCSTEMNKAQFDTKNCGSCAARSKVQVALFPDAKQDGDRCMDRSCFFTKTKQHFGAQATALRNMSVKVYSQEQAFDNALKKAGRTASLIASNERDANSQKPVPAKWKTECAKCEKRAFAFYDRQTWQGKMIETKWACLEKKCLDAMNKIKKSKTSAPEFTQNMERHSSPEHARSCRDRFLYREVAPRVEKSPALQLRLAIYHLLEHFEELVGAPATDKLEAQEAETTRAILFKEITGQKLGSNKYSGTAWFTHEDYSAIAVLPEKKLQEILLKIVVASVQHTEPEVLLLMTPEAGIDLNKSLLVDKDYLNSKTKSELTKLAKELKLTAAKTIHDGMSKPAIVDFLLTQNLTGKLPKDIADRCELKILERMRGIR